jgi:hypothetical protein
VFTLFLDYKIKTKAYNEKSKIKKERENTNKKKLVPTFGKIYQQSIDDQAPSFLNTETINHTTIYRLEIT